MIQNEHDRLARAAEIRREAERVASERALSAPERAGPVSPAEAGSELHELRVHQIELEMQNDELLRIQAELDAARARYFDLYDQAPIGFITLTERGTIADANANAERALHVPRGALRQQPLERFILSEDQDIYYLVRKRLAETGTPQVCELRMIGETGKVFWAQQRIAMTPDAGGARLTRIGIIDVSEQKRAEDEQRKLQAKLNDAQKLESVGRLAGGVAHDFNNMLTVILGRVHVGLSKLSANDPLRDELQEIGQAAERAAELTRQLLAYARKQVISPKVVDLNDTVGSVISMLRRLVAANTEIRWTPTPDLWRVRIDSSQLDQVLVNLCLNASAAMTSLGTVTIETGNCTLDAQACALHPQAVPGDYVRITVADTGRGMDANTLEHIFEPFFTTRDVGAGSGLALATVHGAIQQNRGFVEARSVLGVGSVFTIYLPRDASDQQTSPTNGHARPAQSGHETLLLVEDEPAVLAVTAKLLTYEGYTVLAANGPTQALALAEAHASEIDLLVTDVIMPEMNGRDLSKKLVRFVPNLKCVYVSGYAADVIGQQGVLEEGAHFVQKPFAVDDLVDKVREALDEPIGQSTNGARSSAS